MLNKPFELLNKIFVKQTVIVWYGCSMFLLPSKLLRHRKSRDSTSSRGPVRRRCRSIHRFLKSDIFWSCGIGKCTFWKVVNSNGIIAWNHCKTKHFLVGNLQKSSFLKRNNFWWRSFRNKHFRGSTLRGIHLFESDDFQWDHCLKPL